MKKMKKIVALLMILVLCLGINTTIFAKEAKQTQKIKVSQTSYTKQEGDSKFKLSVTTTGNGKLTYKSGNKKVVTVSSSGVVTVVGKGSTKISITAAETKKYKKATKSIKITVKEKVKIPEDIKLSTTGTTYAVMVLEDGTEVPAGGRITYSQLLKAKVRIYLDPSSSGCVFTYIGTSEPYTEEDLEYANWAYSEVIFIEGKLKDYDEIRKRFDNWSMRVYTTTSLVETVQYKESHLAICMSNLDEKAGHSNTIINGWVIDLDN